MKKLFITLVAVLAAVLQASAATKKAYADFSQASAYSNATWDAETMTLTWTATYGNQLTNVGLPSGDISGYEKIVVECKSIASIGAEQRQQLWNYMRLTKSPIGILYNFAPAKDQCEKYYFDCHTNIITAF